MLWAISSYFNPSGYTTKKQNYDLFRAHLTIPLLSVELSFNQQFELKKKDADRVLYVQGKDIMWQKERLLNIALQHLPDNCTAIAWLDADVIFDNPDWAEETMLALEKYPLVQPYKELNCLNQGQIIGEKTTLKTENRSFASALHHEENIMRYFNPSETSQSSRVAPGKAWAGRRSVLEQVGFYDAMIIGGGDRAMLNALCGEIDTFIISHKLNPARAEHYKKWAQMFYSLVKGNVGYTQGLLTHLWHGSIENRSYQQRKKILPPDFNPAQDIKHLETGAWEWASEKPELHRIVSEYFETRREDG